jgi:hypothetical protein
MFSYVLLNQGRGIPVNTQVPESKPERMRRGSFPPYLGLTEAFDLTRLIYEQGGGQASFDLMSRLTGNSSSSSNFIKKIGAMKLYGLVSEQNGTLMLTEQGFAIAAPTNEGSDGSAKKASLLSVPTFAKLFDRHKGKLLPADEFLRNIIEQDIGIPRELSSEWVRAFKDAAKAAALLFSRPDGKIQILETPSFETERQAVRGEPLENSTPQPNPHQFVDVSARAAPVAGATQAVPVSASGHNTRFELSDGRLAEFSIPFGISGRDAKRLKGFLKGLEFIIDSAIVGDEVEPK